VNISGETKFVVGIILSVVILIATTVFLMSKPETTYSFEQMAPSGSAIQGKVDSKVYLVEFSDFQCPACREYKRTVDELIQKYGDKFIFVYRHFPLPQHQYARLASEAFEASGEQDEYWEMYDYLFTNQQSLSESFILDAGKNLGLNEEKYKESVLQKKHQSKIDRDVSDAKSLGISGTPTFFLNGKKLNLNNPAQLKVMIEEAIK
jgi:protein-disulfide isomerase